MIGFHYPLYPGECYATPGGLVVCVRPGRIGYIRPLSGGMVHAWAQ